MFKFTIITIGKNKEKWLQEALFEYEKRLKNQAVFNWVLLKDEKSLSKRALKEKNKNLVLLDLKGQALDSSAWTKTLQKLLEIHNSKLTFVIGGDTGIPTILKAKSVFSLSLSKLTFTHQICRLILLEQIYRSFEILKNSKYHK